MQEELYTVLRVADLSRLAAAEFKPEGAPIVSGELKTIQYNTNTVDAQLKRDDLFDNFAENCARNQPSHKARGTSHVPRTRGHPTAYSSIGV